MMGSVTGTDILGKSQLYTIFAGLSLLWTVAWSIYEHQSQAQAREEDRRARQVLESSNPLPSPSNNSLGRKGEAVMDKSEIAIAVSLAAFIWTVVWSIYTHRHSAKPRNEERQARENQNKEQARITASLETSGGGIQLKAEVLNTGSVPIPKMKVELVWREGADTTAKLTLRNPIVRNEITTSGPFKMVTGFNDIVELPARLNVEFFLPSLPIELLSRLIRFDQSDIWLAASSPSGEVGRFQGVELLVYLRELNKALEANGLVAANAGSGPKP
jgi:hypothetical protein